MFNGNIDAAEIAFKQARDLAPNSAYVHAMCASFELARGQVGVAEEHANEACRRATHKTGALCYQVKARILEQRRDKQERVQALRQALEYEPTNSVIRHQYGVALSIAGKSEEAIEEFTHIIEEEKKRVPAREQNYYSP
jgi:thioredoxin-like negative regulator of GroEL